MELPIIERGTNPYRDNVQGKANEPITVAGLLDRAKERIGESDLEYSLEEIWDRLEANCPRIAIIGGSPDQPAHILDLENVLYIAVQIWRRGGVPFYFSIPVLCDGTAQNNLGMCYSLQSRNLVAEMIINQMEAHSYHGAVVLSGCDKTPFGIVCGLAHLDIVRQRRGDAPVFASFVPSHVLRGGTLPSDLRADLETLARRAEDNGYPHIARDLCETMRYILQCTTNSAFQGVLTRARQAGLISLAEHKEYERRLAVHTCDRHGGVCAFYGTGNSSRIALAALGLTHPGVELLTRPPEAHRLRQVVDDLFTFVNQPVYSVSNLIRTNFANAVRVYSATGGSTNLMLHLVAASLYAGVDADVWTIDRIRRNPPVPDIFDYSLTEGRDIFALAKQCENGQIRGVETIFYELLNLGIPMDLDAPTVTGNTWRERLSDTANLSARGVTDNPVILHIPRRPFSGVEVLESNFFETAVVKVSGMTSEQIAHFDEQVGVVLFFENEAEANEGLLDPYILDRLKACPSLTHRRLLALAAHNRRSEAPTVVELKALDRSMLFERLVELEWLKVVIVISGQGPEAFGMPEMFTPMQHINANLRLRRLATLLSDGRFSGVTYGAAIGHVTPEAFRGGRIGLLETGDLVHIRLRKRRLDLIDPHAFEEQGEIRPWEIDLRALRSNLAEARYRRMQERLCQIAAPNRLRNVTDASKGVIPLVVLEEVNPLRQN